MKRMFKQELYDCLFTIINNNNWHMEWECEKQLNQLIELSIDRLSHRDCEREELRNFAKTNLSCLLTYMYIDCRSRHVGYLDVDALTNALSSFDKLWPFKGNGEISMEKYVHTTEAEDFVWYY
jgi:hypothetical protein